MKRNKPDRDFVLLEVMLLGSSLAHLMKSGAGVRETLYYRKLSEFLEVHLFQYFPSNTVDHNSGGRPFKNKWVHSTIGVLKSLKDYKSESIDIVRSKQLFGSWTGWLLSIFLQKPHVLRCGYIWSRSFSMERKINGLLHWLVEKVEIFILKRADSYIFCSKDIEKFYKPYIGAKPYIVLPNYVDESHFYPDPSVNKVDQFLYLGRFIELKGAGEAANFINQLGLSHRSTFIGQGPMSDKIQSSGIRIIQSIPNDRLRKIMTTHRFFLSLSKTEGSPKALLEAIFCGLIPILSDIPVHREIIEKLGYGLIIDETKDFDFDQQECRVDYDKLAGFMHEFSMENHIAAEVEFLQQCVNRG